MLKDIKQYEIWLLCNHDDHILLNSNIMGEGGLGGGYCRPLQAQYHGSCDMELASWRHDTCETYVGRRGCQVHCKGNAERSNLVHVCIMFGQTGSGNKHHL